MTKVIRVCFVIGHYVHMLIQQETRSAQHRITTLPPLPPRPADGNKGMFGPCAGDWGKCRNARRRRCWRAPRPLRSGAGLVQIAVPKSILSACMSIRPELIGLGLGKTSGKPRCSKPRKKADAVVIGPGLGQSPVTKDRVMRVVRVAKPMVVDADALNILAAASDGLRNSRQRRSSRRTRARCRGWGNCSAARRCPGMKKGAWLLRLKLQRRSARRSC